MPGDGRIGFLSGDELDRLIGVLERHRTHYPDDVDATMLAALTGTTAFAAGASYFGVADLLRLAQDTHDFESRYLDGLIGPSR